MSLLGEIYKYTGDIRRDISNIANKNIAGRDGAIKGTKKIFGYVCNINEDGDLAGTVDVQEFGYEAGDYTKEGVGHHSGVYLSAIQDNAEGFLIVPMMYSEVVIVQSPIDGKEYVIMYSHAKRIQVNAHEDIEIGVTEVEDFVETDDGLEKDYNELEPTKNRSFTHYNATSIVDNVVSPEDEKGLRQEKTAKQKVITVGDTTITIDGQNVSIETSGNVSFIIGDTKITENNGSVEIKANDVKIDSTNCEIKTSSAKIDSKDCNVKGSNVTITGGKLNVKGTSTTDLNGPFNPIKVCPFSGAPHCGSMVSGT